MHQATGRTRHARSRAGPGRSLIGRRRAQTEGDGQGVGHQTGEPDGNPYLGLARDQSPPKEPILRDRRLADLIVVGEHAVLVSVVSPAIIDALAALEAGTEDRGDSELAIESATWSWSCFLASLAAGGALLHSGALLRPAPA